MGKIVNVRIVKIGDKMNVNIIFRIVKQLQKSKKNFNNGYKEIDLNIRLYYSI